MGRTPCARQVVLATSDEAKESASVGVLQEQLRALQADVDAASRRLAATRARVEMNMKRVDELRAEAVRRIRCPCWISMQGLPSGYFLPVPPSQIVAELVHYASERHLPVCDAGAAREDEDCD